VAETTKVGFFHVAQFGRLVGFGAIHAADFTIRSCITYMIYKTYF
jgi:hypothetical protein